jgi:hypothetical protein
MHRQDRDAQVIAAAIIATGTLFLSAGLFEFSFLTVLPPGAYFLTGLSIVFILGGGYFFIKAWRGHLEPQGKTITEVRIQAIEKMDSAELLSQIASEDPDNEVRAKALERLESIAA